MSLAARTRDAARSHPYLLTGLRAGVVNYAEAARWLDISDDTQAVATALRRFAHRLPALEIKKQPVQVTMQPKLAQEMTDNILAVDGSGYATDDGSFTGIKATGNFDAEALSHVLDVLAAHDIEAVAAGVADESLVIIVNYRDGPASLRVVEESFQTMPQ